MAKNCKNMSLKFIRRFHGVGQGLFCSEIVKSDKTEHKLAVVYDCGTMKKEDKTIIQNIIDNEDFPKEIDFLFISHFHSDHINCIKYLLGKRVVKHIVMPKITPFQIISACVASSDNYKNEDREFLEQLFSQNITIGDNKKIDYIIIDPFITEDLSAYQDHILSITKENLIFPFKDETTSFDIRYIPFNIESEKTIYFIDAFCKMFKGLYDEIENFKPNSITDLLKINGNFDKVKDLYNNFFPNANETSMPVLSMLVKKDLRCYNGDSTSWGCLYTGDYSANVDNDAQKLLTFYKPYLRDISIMQVPHHGSKYDNPQSLYGFGCKNYILSYGTGNTYDHPGTITYINILKYNGVAYDLTEKSQTIEAVLDTAVHLRKPYIV